MQLSYYYSIFFCNGYSIERYCFSSFYVDAHSGIFALAVLTYLLRDPRCRPDHEKLVYVVPVSLFYFIFCSFECCYQYHSKGICCKLTIGLEGT